LKEAYFNSPAMALPNQGFGISGLIYITPDIYLSGGIHDANGDATNFLVNNMNSFFTQKEYFTWIEAGYNEDCEA
jgi:porin